MKFRFDTTTLPRRERLAAKIIERGSGRNFWLDICGHRLNTTSPRQRIEILAADIAVYFDELIFELFDEIEDDAATITPDELHAFIREPDAERIAEELYRQFERSQEGKEIIDGPTPCPDCGAVTWNGHHADCDYNATSVVTEGAP